MLRLFFSYFKKLFLAFNKNQMFWFFLVNNFFIKISNKYKKNLNTKISSLKANYIQY